MEECEDCGQILDSNYVCKICEEFHKIKERHHENYHKDTSRFKWRHHTCADGYVFYLDGKEYTNLNELKDDINKLLK